MSEFDTFDIPRREEITEALAGAFDRIDDFLAVQSGQGGISLDSVKCLQTAVGIENEARLLFKDRLEEVSKSSNPGQVLLGLIVGLLAVEHPSSR